MEIIIMLKHNSFFYAAKNKAKAASFLKSEAYRTN